MGDSILKQTAELIGFSAPFLYASTTFGLFAYVDKNLSKSAKKAISQWLKPVEVDAVAVSTALLEIFDRIYGSQLLSWRAFGRSALISLVVTAIYILEFKKQIDVDFYNIDLSFFVYFILPVIFNVVTDYISLFAIRAWLKRRTASPLTTLMVGATIGIAVIVPFFLLRVAAYELSVIAQLMWEAQTINLNMTLPQFVLVTKMIIADYWNKNWHQTMLAPAFAVYLWLPLFAIGVVAARLFNPIVNSVGWLQWLVVNGRNRPVEAIGYIAAAVVFVTTALVAHLKSVLS
jgi:hypothetical protein